MIDIIIAIVSLLALGFLALWYVRHDLRGWMEAPARQFITQERRYRCSPLATSPLDPARASSTDALQEV